MPRSNRILAVDDEVSVSEALALILGERVHEVLTAKTVAEVEGALLQAPFGLGPPLVRASVRPPPALAGVRK